MILHISLIPNGYCVRYFVSGIPPGIFFRQPARKICFLKIYSAGVRFFMDISSIGAECVSAPLDI